MLLRSVSVSSRFRIGINANTKVIHVALLKNTRENRSSVTGTWGSAAITAREEDGVADLRIMTAMMVVLMMLSMTNLMMM